MVSLREADKYGYAWEEYERLKLRGSPRFIAVRAALKIGGRLSKGIDLGWQSGFDSGRSLDYVYENRPQGSSRLGRFIDTNYLNSIGWRGIRQRKVNLERALRDAIEKLQAEGRPIRILDIAAGAGRYVLETMRALPDISISAILRDNKQENVDAARALAEEFGLENVTVGIGDAFDRAALAALTPRATIGVVSGLYELFPSNDAVLESLGGLSGAIEPGGYLIYTNQPWHPQLEFIARVLRNREGKRWIMRRRTTAEIDELVRTGGFREMRDGNRSMGDVYRCGRAPRSHLKTGDLVSRGKAFAASVGLSLLFLLVYGACLWVTARRDDVRVFYFAWERAIPFVPFMILPYMSIDLFFVAAPFLFRNARELKVFVARVASAIFLAGICFLARAASLRLSATACGRFARRALRLVSRDGRALQSLSLAPRRNSVFPDRRLRAPPARSDSIRRDVLVRADWSLSAADSSTSRDRYPRRLCFGRGLLLFYPAKILPRFRRPQPLNRARP